MSKKNSKVLLILILLTISFSLISCKEEEPETITTTIQELNNKELTEESLVKLPNIEISDENENTIVYLETEEVYGLIVQDQKKTPNYLVVYVNAVLAEDLDIKPLSRFTVTGIYNEIGGESVIIAHEVIQH